MSNQNSYSPGSRPRRGNNRGGSRRPGGNYNRNSAPKKKTFWQKFLGFFGIGKSQPKQSDRKYPAYKSESSESSERAERPPRQPREARETRKPELIEVTSPKIYVGNLSFDATESDLSELFNGVGQVQTVEIVSHRDTERSKGFAFVTMQTVEEAKRAVEVLHDKDFMGRKLVVSGAKTSDVRNAA